MTRSLSVLLVFIVSSLLSLGVQARALYDEETSQFAGTLRSLMVRAERVQPRDVNGVLSIQEELFELSKKLHRLEEEALTANLELFKRGEFLIDSYYLRHQSVKRSTWLNNLQITISRHETKHF